MISKLNLSKLLLFFCLLFSIILLPQSDTFHPRPNTVATKTLIGGFRSGNDERYDRPQSSCHEYTILDFNQIPNLHNSDLPAAYAIAPPTDHFSIGTLCMDVLVYIPHQYGKNVSSGLAIENYPPDSIYFEIIGNDFQTVPKISDKYTAIDLEGEGLIRHYHMYLEFKDGDTYNIAGYLEYINYLWNFEEPKDVFWSPFSLHFIQLTGSKFKVIEKLELIVEGPRLDFKSYHRLPICDNGNANGRWVKSSMIEDKRLNGQSSSTLTAPRDSMTYFKDLEDRMWVPYSCRYQLMAYSEFTSCMSKSHSHIHFYGDSNIRRALKAITTGGAWCNTLYDPNSHECECSDQDRVQVPYMVEKEWVNYFGNVAGSSEFSILYERVNGFRGFHSPHGSFDQILNTSHLAESFKKLGMKEIRKPDAVIFNLVNWDSAFDKWADFKINVMKMVESMKTSYSGVPLIFRPGQYFEGHVDPSTGFGLPRRYSRLRVEAFNQFAIQTFQQYLPNQIKIWDIAALGEAQPLNMKRKVEKCHSNHMFRKGIDLENQVLFNLLCSQK